MKVKSLSCVRLFATKWTVVHTVLQGRILEWVAFPFSKGASQPRDQTQVSHIAGGFFTTWVYKLNNQDDNIHPWIIPFSILSQAMEE